MCLRANRLWFCIYRFADCDKPRKGHTTLPIHVQKPAAQVKHTKQSCAFLFSRRRRYYIYHEFAVVEEDSCALYMYICLDDGTLPSPCDGM